MQTKNTANKEEINKFDKLAEEWWNPNGKFAPLHKFNPVRQEYLIDQISNHFNLNLDEDKPFKNLKILDVGCGGGLLCEPLSRLGANVTGIDAAKTNIEVAKIHMEQSGLDINYLNKKPEDIENKLYDVVLCMEIIEHVENVNFFIQSCINLLKPNGLIFFATLNKTLKSYVLAIVGAEYILRWLPIGTHEWEKFLKPKELISILKNYNLNLDKIDGMQFNILTDKWKVSLDKSVNYIAKFIKS